MGDEIYSNIEFDPPSSFHTKRHGRLASCSIPMKVKKDVTFQLTIIRGWKVKQSSCAVWEPFLDWKSWIREENFCLRVNTKTNFQPELKIKVVRNTYERKIYE